MFSDENDLAALREKTNAEFIEKHGAHMTVSQIIPRDNFRTWFPRQDLSSELLVLSNHF